MKLSANQKGATLVELMIGLALSLIVTSSMVALMGNSLGATSRIIQMTQLTDEMRNAMSMVTRDVRRANYSSAAIHCYSNPDCGADGTTIHSDVTINTDENCLIFNLDRNQDNFGHGGTAPGGITFSNTDFQFGGFRLADDSGIGYVEMWVGDGSAACDDAQGADDDEWLALTDPAFVDVTTFLIDRNEDIEDEIVPEESGSEIRQRTNEVKVTMIGTLRSNADVTKRIEDTIKVRNDFILRVNPS